MKQREISATGVVNSNGGLVMPMAELNEFFRKHKGERIVARFFVAPSRCSDALKGYYYHYVVPTIKRALWETGDRKTEEQTERFLRELSPTCYEEQSYIEGGNSGYNTRLREIPELSNAEMLEHLETIRQFAAEELNVFVDDPQTI